MNFSINLPKHEKILLLGDKQKNNYQLTEQLQFQHHRLK